MYALHVEPTEEDSSYVKLFNTSPTRNMLYTSEAKVLESIDTIFEKSGRGDDCAILSQSSHVISLDIFSENTDFRRTTFLPYQIGYKALAVNISDILAMLANPTAFMLGLIIPPTTTQDYLENILQGMKTIGSQYNTVKLIGGDISLGDIFTFAITIFGTPYKTPALRGNSSVGDVLFYISAVENPLGLARVGFDILETAGSKNTLHAQYPHAINAQCTPSLLPNSTIEKLSQFSEEISLMDISDGLAQDIPRLLNTKETQLGATISLTEKILHKELLQWCTKNNYNPFEYAFIGGEEYSLLGSCSKELFIHLHSILDNCVKIGTITENSTIFLNNLPYTKQGFDHFN